MQKRRKAGRSKRGNMIAITVLCIALVLFACIVLFGFYMLLTEQQRSQGVMDQVALGLAKKMNDGDRIGGLNNLLTLNRELVAGSRQVEMTTSTYQDLNFAEPLALQLLNEARSSADNLEKYRQQQIKETKQNIRFEVDRYNLNRQNLAHFNLPWWQSFEPQIHAAFVGNVDDTESNVQHNDFYRPLNDFDDYQRFVQAKSNLFHGNINAKLPSSDGDLDYNLAALAAPVENTVAPGRILNGEAFKESGPVIIADKTVEAKIKQVPTAVEVLATMQVSSGDNKSQMKIASIAACPGAQPLPPYPQELTDYWAWAPDGTNDMGAPYTLPTHHKKHNKKKGGGSGGTGGHMAKNSPKRHENVMQHMREKAAARSKSGSGSRGGGGSFH